MRDSVTRAGAVWHDLRQRQKSLASDIVRIYGFQAVIYSVGFVTSAGVARAIGPEQQGTVALFNVVLHALSEVGVFGFGTGLVFHLGHRRCSVAEAHGTAAVAALALGSVVAVAGSLSSGALEPLLGGLEPWMIMLAFGIAPAIFYRSTWANILVATDAAVVPVRVVALSTVATAIVTLIAWRADALRAETVVTIASVATATAAVGSAALLRWLDPAPLRFSWSLLTSSVRYGGVVYVGLLANMLHYRVDQLMVSRYRGLDDVGIYAIAVQWAEALFLLDSAISAAGVQRIASLPAAESRALTARLSRLQVAISTVAALGVGVGATVLVPRVYGEEYRSAVGPLVALLPGVIAWSLARLWSQYLSFNLGRQWLPTWFAIAGLTTNVALNAVLIPRHGILGAAAASSLSYGIVMILTWAAATLVKEPRG